MWNKLENGLTVVLIASCLFLWSAPVEASWFVDEARYHISSHGQTSCQDCHENIAAKPLHPDPSEIRKARGDFFSSEICFSCHDEIQDNLAASKHGRKKIKNPKKYSNCIRCHKPHRQRPMGENRTGAFKPGVPRQEQCEACHEMQSKLPALSEEDEACMTCHRATDPGEPGGRKKIQTLCFHCHAKGETPARKATAILVPFMDPDGYENTPHANQACTACHPGGASFFHHDQEKGDCFDCHSRHDEKQAHDAHLNVTCEACHLQGIKPIRNSVSRAVGWKRTDKPGNTLTVHRMITGQDKSHCNRCHIKGNRLGAAAMVLPAKSIVCMGCHAATFSVGDTTTVIALLIFLAGIVMVLSYWVTGTFSGRDAVGPVGEAQRSLFGRTVRVSKSLILDVLLQRRLFRQSEGRWLIHALIFYPFLFRFVWGMAGLLGSLLRPEAGTVWVLLDKNHHLTALLFDISGVLLLLGIFLALLRGTLKRFTQLPGLPKQDPVALGLIAGIVVVGFVLEGMRMAMTGLPGNAEYAVVGYAISKLFSNPSGLTSVYGYLWYGHAVLAAGFVAYLPFSRLLHIILAPVVLLMDAATEHHSGKEKR